MSKHIRRTVTITITETWTITWTDGAQTCVMCQFRQHIPVPPDGPTPITQPPKSVGEEVQEKDNDELPGVATRISAQH